MFSFLKKPGRTQNGQRERWTLLEIDGKPEDVRIVENPRTSRMTLRLVPASRKAKA